MSDDAGKDRRVAGPPPRASAPAAPSSLIKSMRPAAPEVLSRPAVADLVPRPKEQPLPTEQIELADVKVTVLASPHLRDRVRAAYTMTHAQENHRTFSEFVCSLLEAEASRLETVYNSGHPFVGGDRSLPRGRPLG